jgi:hypothetical protein
MFKEVANLAYIVSVGRAEINKAICSKKESGNKMLFMPDFCCEGK